MQKELFNLSWIFFICFTVFAAINDATATNVNFQMAEKTIDWLEFRQRENDSLKLKNYFMSQVATTGGCQAIIHHWERFKDWNKDLFYSFIMEALEKQNSLWQKAAANPQALRRDLQALKRIDLKGRAERMARKYLPEDVKMDNNFYVVIFGASSAFSVGKENGFDLLQLPRNADGTINIDAVLLTFAHEMHHTGFDYFHSQYKSNITEESRITLAGILAAEGTATYYIDRPMDHLEEMRHSEIELRREVAADWEKHSSQLANLYSEAQKDLWATLQDSIEIKTLFPKWMGGAKGAAYVLGADIIRVIENYSGHNRAMEVIRDYRLLIKNYNYAANKANSRGDSLFVFDPELASRIANYQGPMED